ncbi:sterol carrier family protein [Streptacidiphilus sp. N1-12]|uniref:Sterol carrier family protein n=2 Tax=Streptacidiphilus alkalitolerans TaxID=3342712 RepID=A0ABV6WDM3_9ACTN
MPPAASAPRTPPKNAGTRTPRARSYDPTRIRTALAAQAEVLRGAVHELCTGPEPEARLAGPTRLGDWRVRELVAHLGTVFDAVSRKAGLDGGPGEPLSLTGWVAATRTEAPAIAAVAQEQAAAEQRYGGTPAEVDAAVAASVERMLKTLADAPGFAPGLRTPTRFGPMLFTDYLVTRVLETVVHGDDLAAALGTGLPPDRQALAATTRLLADALAAQAPGGAVELRIPPFAVVQCVAGPRHTRGTPPNVVETSPAVWIRLATGRRSWAEALDVAELTASGERSDLSRLLPVMG